MQVSKVNIREPLCYFKCGQFQSVEGWKHKKMCLDGDYEIILGLSKEIFLNIGGTPYVVKPGDIYLIPPYVTFEGNRGSEDEASFYWLHFFPRLGVYRSTDAQMLEELWQIKNIHSEQTVFDYRRADCFTYLPFYFHAEAPEKLYILMRQILDVSNSNYYSQYCTDYLVTCLALEITEQYRQNCMRQNPDQAESSKRFSEILEWIRVNIYNNPTVHDIAERFSFHPDYLTRLFKKNLHMGTSRYINIQKINTVKGLLSTTTMSTKEIAYLLNFKDEKYLMRLFKDIEGLTISQYRDAYINTYLNNIQVDPDIPVPTRITEKKEMDGI